MHQHSVNKITLLYPQHKCKLSLMSELSYTIFSLNNKNNANKLRILALVSELCIVLCNPSLETSRSFSLYISTSGTMCKSPVFIE